jgi:hypothetical protein
MQALLNAMSSKTPQTASNLLDYVAVMLWHQPGLGYVALDPCEALNESGERVTEREHSAFQLAWAVFALAGGRTTPARRAAWSPPMATDLARTSDDKKNPAQG